MAGCFSRTMGPNLLARIGCLTLMTILRFRSELHEKSVKKKVARTVPVERHRLTFQILRLIKGRKNSEVATKAGVCHQTILNLRKAVDDGGTLAPRVDSLDKIARAFGMKLQFVEMGAAKGVSKHQTREDRNSVTASLN